MWPLCDLTCFLRFERSNSGIVSQNWGSDGHFDVLNKFKSFWFKSYDADFHFRLELKERGFAFFCFCHYFWTNWDLDMSSTSKWASESQFCKIYWCSWKKMAKNGRKTAAWLLCDLTSFLICKNGTTIAKKCPS